MDKMKKYIHYRIIATLTYGKKLSIGILVLVAFANLLGLIMILSTIICAIFSQEYVVLICLILPFIVVPILWYIFFISLKERFFIKKWKEDAVLLPAHVFVVDELTNNISKTTKWKIIVKFRYNGKIIKQSSGDKIGRKEGLFNVHPGYDAVYGRYIYKQATYILYSPQYDEVMLLTMKE